MGSEGESEYAEKSSNGARQMRNASCELGHAGCSSGSPPAGALLQQQQRRR